MDTLELAQILNDSPADGISYTRAQLIAICEKAVVPVNKWRDRDTPKAISCVGECWVKLKAGCEFKIRTHKSTVDMVHDGIISSAYMVEGTDTVGDTGLHNDMIYLFVFAPDYLSMQERAPAEHTLTNCPYESYYLPTPKKLLEKAGEDWYD